MPTYTVLSDAAAALFPQGLQEAMSLVNDGPATILIDSQSSISAGQSLALPPSASIVWDADQPLYARSVGAASTLRITPNRFALDASRAGLNKLLYTSNSVFTSVTNTYVSTPSVECSAYRTLIVSIVYDSGLADTVWHMKIDWYDDSGNLLLTETNTIFLFDASGVGTLKWNTNFPVKGAAAIVSIKADVAGSKHFNLVQIFGTTNVLAFQATPGLNAEVRLGTHSVEYDRDAGVLAAPFDLATAGAAISLAPLGNQLSVRVFTPLGVTVAGIVRVRDSLTNVIKYGEINIPTSAAGNGNVYGSLIYVPRGRPIDVVVDAAPTYGGTARMSAVWVDY